MFDDKEINFMREALLGIMLDKKLSATQVASELEMAPATIRGFLHNKKKTQLVQLLAIKRYVEKDNN